LHITDNESRRGQNLAAAHLEAWGEIKEYVRTEALNNNERIEIVLQEEEKCLSRSEVPEGIISRPRNEIGERGT